MQFYVPKRAIFVLRSWYRKLVHATDSEQCPNLQKSARLAFASRERRNHRREREIARERESEMEGGGERDSERERERDRERD